MTDVHRPRWRSDLVWWVRDRDDLTVHLRGPLDGASADKLAAALSPFCAGPLVVDMSEVTMLERAAVPVLLAAAGLQRRNGDALVLRSPSSTTLQTLAEAGAIAHFVIAR
jgi:anti-anti-sigma factor